MIQNPKPQTLTPLEVKMIFDNSIDAAVSMKYQDENMNILQCEIIHINAKSKSYSCVAIVFNQDFFFEVEFNDNGIIEIDEI